MTSTMARVKRWGRLSALAACLVVASACASGPTPTAAEVQTAQQRLDEVLVSIKGTEAQRSAGYLVQYRLLQDAVTDCMAVQGFEYQAPGFYDGAQAMPQVGLNSEWLMPLPTISTVTSVARESAALRAAARSGGERPLKSWTRMRKRLTNRR